MANIKRTVKENAGGISETVTLDDLGFLADLVVDYNINYSLGGTAIQGADYSVNITEGVGSATINVTVVQDDIPEQTETIVATVTGFVDYVGPGGDTEYTNINGGLVRGTLIREPISGTITIEILDCFDTTMSSSELIDQAIADATNNPDFDRPAIGPQSDCRAIQDYQKDLINDAQRSIKKLRDSTCDPQSEGAQALRDASYHLIARQSAYARDFGDLVVQGGTAALPAYNIGKSFAHALAWLGFPALEQRMRDNPDVPTTNPGLNFFQGWGSAGSGLLQGYVDAFKCEAPNLPNPPILQPLQAAGSGETFAVAQLADTVFFQYGTDDDGATAGEFPLLNYQKDVDYTTIEIGEPLVDLPAVLFVTQTHDQIDTTPYGDFVLNSGTIGTLNTMGGDDTVISAGQIDQLNTGSGSDQVTLYGNVGTVDLGEDDDLIIIDGGSNSVQAGSGRDTAIIHAGSGSVDFGDDDDQAVFTGQKDRFQIVQDAGGITVTSDDGRVSFSLTNVETLIFDDCIVDAVTLAEQPRFSILDIDLFAFNADTEAGDVVAQFQIDPGSGLTLEDLTFDFLFLETFFSIEGNQIKASDGFDFAQISVSDIPVTVYDSSGEPAPIANFYLLAQANGANGITDLDLDGTEITENASENTIVGILQPTGAGPLDVTQYSIVGNQPLFDILGNKLVVAAGANLDFETATQHTVRIAASNGTGTAYEEDFIIQVANMPISDIAMVSGGTVKEGAAADTVVATFEASENPVEPTADFSIVSGGDGQFYLDGNELKVSPGATFDFDDQSNYFITFSATDGNGPAYEESFDIFVENVGPILGTPDEDVLDGTEFSDEIQALESDDIINASFGDDDIDGGPGTDTVVYARGRNQITHDWQNDGTIVVTRTALGEGTDTLTNVERIDLDDGSLLYDVGTPNLGFGYRIYQASFDRTPDEGGVLFWIGVLDDLDNQGWSQYEKEQFLASQFIQSDEFKALFGANPTNEQYIDAMYQNVLDRLPDQGGYDFWVGGMVNDGLTREDILIAFTKSDENVDRTAPDLDDGVWVV